MDTTIYLPNQKPKKTKTYFNPSTFQNYLNSSNGVLIIHRVTNTTVGMYRCIATNDAGSSQANIYLKVTYGNDYSIILGQFFFWFVSF
jgi:outer membrane receptor for ferric coprogen and ferric-rhodotorulic acid